MLRQDSLQIVNRVIQQVDGVLLHLITMDSISQFIVVPIEVNGIHVLIATLMLVILKSLVALIVTNIIKRLLIVIIEELEVIVMLVQPVIVAILQEEIDRMNIKIEE